MSSSVGGVDSTSFTITVSDGVATDSQLVRMRTGNVGYCSGRPALEPLVYPNPTPANATLSFWTSRHGRLLVTLHDMRGRRLRTLLDMSDAPPANYRVAINVGIPGVVGYLASGVYFYRVEGVDGVSTGRLLLIRAHSDVDR